MAELIHVCFVLLDAYSLFNTETSFKFGGAEVRGSLLAKALAERSEFRVSCVVNDHGQQGVSQFGKVYVYAHPGYSDQPKRWQQYQRDIAEDVKLRGGFPFIQFKHFAWSTVIKLILISIKRLVDQMRFGAVNIDGYPIPAEKYRIYDTIDADIYCHFGTISRVAEVVAYCHARGKKFVLFGASDRDFTSADTDDPLKAVDDWSLHAVRYIVDHANLIITQTQQQANLLQKNYGKSSVVINNPIDLTVSDISQSKKYVLWVGKSDPKKNPDLLIDLARQCPNISFLMVLNCVDLQIFERIQQNKPDNVEIREYVPFREMDQIFQQAFVLVNTSPMEGFPNTFLQAGKHAVPVLSYQVDVDGYLVEKQCGILAHGDFGLLVDGLQKLLLDAQNDNLFGENHRSYVAANYNLDDKVTQLAKQIQSVMSKHWSCFADA